MYMHEIVYWKHTSGSVSNGRTTNSSSFPPKPKQKIVDSSCDIIICVTVTCNCSVSFLTKLSHCLQSSHLETVSLALKSHDHLAHHSKLLVAAKELSPTR